MVSAAVGRVAFRRMFALEDDPAAAELAVEADTDLVTVTPQVLERVSHTRHPRGPVGIVEIPPPPALEPIPTLVAWEVSDPGNTGTLIRVAAAFGLQYAWGGSGADPWAPKVVRAAAGAHFTCSPVGPVGIADVVSCGLRSMATVVSGGMAPAEVDWSVPTAVFIGSEAHGLPAEVVASVELNVTIPVAVESLNAAMAGAVIAYEMVR